MTLEFFQTWVIPIVTFLFGVLFSSLKSDRLAKGKLLLNQISLIEKLKELSIDYWTNEGHDPDNVVLEVRIRGVIHELSENYDDILWIFGLNEFHTKYSPKFRSVFSATTGGDFENANRGPSPSSAIRAIQETTRLIKILESRKRNIEGINPFLWYGRSK